MAATATCGRLRKLTGRPNACQRTLLRAELTRSCALRVCGLDGTSPVSCFLCSPMLPRRSLYAGAFGGLHAIAVLTRGMRARSLSWAARTSGRRRAGTSSSSTGSTNKRRSGSLQRSRLTGKLANVHVLVHCVPDASGAARTAMYPLHL